MENQNFRLTFLNRIGMLLLVLIQWSFTSNHGHETYEAVDEYKNVVFVLTLHQDRTYTFQENYLDGSVWKDKGTWSQVNERVCLKSSNKTRREHNYLKFSKAIKFKGDEFKKVGNNLVYLGNGNPAINGHYVNLTIAQTNQTYIAKESTIVDVK